MMTIAETISPFYSLRTQLKPKFDFNCVFFIDNWGREVQVIVQKLERESERREKKNCPQISLTLVYKDIFWYLNRWIE